MTEKEALADPLAPDGLPSTPSGFVWAWLPWIALTVAVLCSIGVFMHQRKVAEDEARLRFGYRVKEVGKAIQERIADYQTILQAGADFLRVSPLADREDWQRFVDGQHIQAKFPGIQGVGFARRVPAAMLQEHTETIRAAGFPDYSVRPPGERTEYAPIIWLVPFDWRNRRAFGYDMLSEPTRREAMERARDSGATSLSGKVRLVQETQEAPQAGFLMYVPLYRYLESPRDIAQRRESITGFVYAPFRMNDLMRGIFGAGTNTDVDIDIFDGGAASQDHLMFDSDDSYPRAANAGLERERPMFNEAVDLDLYGHRWHLVIESTPQFEATVDRATPLGAAAVLFAFGLLVFQGLNASTRMRVEAQRLARNMTAELADREARLRALFESIHDGVIVIDADGRIENCNPAAVDMFGWRQAEMAGIPIDMLLPTATAMPTPDKDGADSAGADAHDGRTRELQALRGDGSAFPVDLSLSEAFSGGRPRYVAVVRDISERKRLDEELRQHRDSLQTMVLERTADLVAAKIAAESANRAKTDFLANMSHELRTPMHAILSFASLGKHRSGDKIADQPIAGETMATTERYFANIDTAGQRLMRLLNDLLDLSRIEASGLVIKPSARRIDGLIDEAIGEFGALAIRNGLSLRSELAEAEVRVDIDAMRIGQVLRNLLGNAMRFTPQSGEIVVLARVVEGAMLQVTVRDSGVGVPHDELESIFDKFVQSSRTRSGAGGTGLGLAICREIINAHGGRIWAENNLGGGASFHFTVPLAHAAAASGLAPAPAIG